MLLFASYIASILNTFQITDSGGFTTAPLNCDDKKLNPRDKEFCSRLLENGGGKFQDEDLNALYNMYWLNYVLMHKILHNDCRNYQKECDDITDHLKNGLWYPKQLIDNLNHLIETTNNF